MSFGNSGFDSEDEVISEINMTPLVDVMLVLLIIFMVTMPVITHAVKLQLPQAAAQPAAAQDSIDIVVDAAGSVSWQGEAVTAPALEQRLAALGRQGTPPALRVSAHRDARYEAVAQVLAAAQRAGLSRVGLVTRP